MPKAKIIFLAVLLIASVLCLAAAAQPPSRKDKQNVRTVTIPISIFTKKELKQDQAAEFVQVDRLIVKEDKDEQTVLSIRSVVEAPLALAILVQDDLSSSFNLQLRDLKKFIRNLPRGSRVMVAYLRGGALQIRQRFTDDLDRAAESLRIVASSSTVAPRNPYDGVIEALNRFDALPAGRRAILLLSDGLDVTQGFSNSIPSQSLDLDRAIKEANKRNVAIYSFFAPSVGLSRWNHLAASYGQSSLNRISDETGGKAFFEGSTGFVTFDPHFRRFAQALNEREARGD